MPRVHTVDHGDTLFGIALKFYGDGMKFPIIAEANGIRGRGFGTMGALVEDTTTGEILGLSNFHVTGPREDAFPDQIWQRQRSPRRLPGYTTVAVLTDSGIDDRLGGVQHRWFSVVWA